MLKLLIGFALGAVATASLSALQTATVNDETRKTLIAIKHAIVAGHRNRDAAELSRLYADDYTAVDSSGAVRTKTDLLKGLATDPEMLEGRYDLIAFRQWGDVAVATGRGHMLYRNTDSSTRVSDYYSFNVFERKNGRWQYAAAFLP